MEFFRRLQAEFEALTAAVMRLWSASKATLGLIILHALGTVVAGLILVEVIAVGLESLIAASRIGIFTSDVKQFLLVFIASSAALAVAAHWSKLWEGIAGRIWNTFVFLFTLIGVVILEFALLPAIILIIPFLLAYRYRLISSRLAFSIIMALIIFWSYDAILSFLSSNEPLTKLLLLAVAYSFTLVQIVKGDSS
jgi:hypothetical protein